jgi:plasmid stabilization system protein ParE
VKGFVVTPLAARDLVGIWDSLAETSPAAADRVLQALQRSMRKLSREPGIGHLREDLADRRHRFFLVYSYLVVYRPDTKPLQVLRVLHAARDVQSLLELNSDDP